MTAIALSEFLGLRNLRILGSQMNSAATTKGDEYTFGRITEKTSLIQVPPETEVYVESSLCW